MKWSSAGGSVALCVALCAVLACGGVAQESGGKSGTAPGDSVLPSGGGRSIAGDAGLGGSDIGGAGLPTGGLLNIDAPTAGASGAPPGISEGAACSIRPPNCNVFNQYVEFEDGTRLPYPLDTSCGRCTFKCEVCDELICSLWAQARIGCGTVHLDVAACAGFDGTPPCLNSSANAPYYIDASGKRWDQMTLSGSQSQLPNPVVEGPVDVDLTLKIGDGLTTQNLALRAHVCAAFYYPLVICN